ncbi:MAG: hypothetical protein ABL963_13775 [Longimicrobiales bacterium]
MTQRRTLGEILVGLGRITETDVAKALEYQRHSGGFFGAALVACGLVSEDEIEWGLASQFDLPYVFPKAEEIDYEAAAMVSPEWALAHLTLPIMRTATTLTVVVESPIKTKAVDELRARTDREVELALASPSKIRELIRQVYARASAADEDTPRPPIGLSDALDIVLTVAASRFGVSVRGARSWIWWDEAGRVRRRPLSGDWQGELERALRPSVASMTAVHPRREWSGELSRGGIVTTVEAQFLSDESGSEYLFHPRPVVSPLRVSYPPPSGGIISEVRLLARSGNARFVFTSAPPELGHELLPHLPELLLDPAWRSIYVHTRDRATALEVFSHRLSTERGSWRAEIESLRAFQFDAVTVDLGGGEGDWLTSALDLGAVSFLSWADGADVGPAFVAGIRWHLHVARRKEGHLDWSLEPLLV